MVDYDRAVVKLGEEKANLERVVNRIKNEITDLNNARDRASQQMMDRRAEVDQLYIKLDELRKEIADAVRVGSEKTSSLREQEEKSQGILGEKKLELKKLEEYFLSLGEKINDKNKELSDLQEKIKITREELVRVQTELSQAKRDLKDVLMRIEQLRKIESELSDVEERVTLLKEENKEGLAGLSVLDAERLRLQEKREFLERKEADLNIYENRLKKHCAKVGYDVKMIFK